MASQREPNSDPNYRYQVEKNQKDISAVCCVGLALALIFVVIRILIRTRLQRQFSTDDYVLILATVSSTIALHGGIQEWIATAC